MAPLLSVLKVPVALKGIYVDLVYFAKIIFHQFPSTSVFPYQVLTSRTNFQKRRRFAPGQDKFM